MSDPAVPRRPTLDLRSLTPARVALGRSGASVLDLQAEGGWRDPRMPGRYTARIDAAHGAMARLARIQEGEADGQGDG